jgi:hypothetical protein
LGDVSPWTPSNSQSNTPLNRSRRLSRAGHQ